MRAITSRSVSLCIMLSLSLLGGCASTSDLDTLRNDVNQLRRDSADLRKETSDLRKETKTIREQTTGMVKEDSFNAIRESQASLYSQISDQSKELQALRGRFDESKFHMDRSLKNSSVELELLRSQINSIDQRIKELNEKIGRAGEAKPALSDQKPGAEESPEKPVEQKKPDDSGPKKIYDDAYTLFKDKKYKAAREKFTAFARQYPNDSLAGNAHFWTGETYYAEKDYENAILAYETLIKQYPKSEKVPGALLKQGMAFIELGDKKTAKIIFEKLIEKHPNAKEAATAKTKIADAEKSDKKPKKGAPR